MDRTSAFVATLLEKMRSADPDYRYMALNDLITRAKSDDFIVKDVGTESRTVNQVLEMMKDTNGEVKNMTVKTLGILVRRVREGELQNITNKLVEYISGKEEELRDIASLGLKTVVVELPPTSKLAASISMKLAPKLIQVIESPTASQELLIDCLEIVTEIFSRFAPSVTAAKKDFQQPSMKAFFTALEHNNAGVRKRAMTAMSILGACASTETFTEICKRTHTDLWSSNKEARRTMTLLTGSLARASPRRIGKRLPDFMTAILPLVNSEEEDDELREACLQTLEVLLLRCPAEITPFVTQCLDAASKSISYDPNYAGDGDSDEEMTADNEDDEDDELDMEDYEDDDDLSWKVRRSAAKVLNAAINTRSEMLVVYAEKTLPILIARTSEREETVRLEVLNTLVALLKQTRLYSAGPQATEVVGISATAGQLKRKFTDIDAEGAASPRAIISSRTEDITKAASKELGSKSGGTHAACLSVFRELVLLLHGGLEASLGNLLAQIEKLVKATDASSGNSVNLKVEMLALLRLIFRLHAPQSYEEHLPKVLPIIISGIESRQHRNSTEALQTASELIVSLFPSLRAGTPSSRSSPPRTGNYVSTTQQIYDAVVERLNRPDSDQAIREQALKTLAILLSHAGDGIKDQSADCFPMLLERLKNEVTRLPTLHLITRVAPSPLCEGPDFEKFFLQAAGVVAELLKLGSRQLKTAAFESLVALLSRIGASMPSQLVDDVLSSVRPMLGQSADISLLPPTLQAVVVILIQQPTSQEKVKQEILSLVYDTLQSPLAQGPALQPLLEFFTAYVRANPALSSSVLDDLLKQANIVQLTRSSHATQTYAVVAKCIGAVVRYNKNETGAQALAAAESGLKQGEAAQPHSFFSLRILGEVGRIEDLSAKTSLVDDVLSFYDVGTEELKNAAAFAMGGMAVGNLATFLPIIEGHITSDGSKRYLSLHAIKEVIVNSKPMDLVPVAERIWQPLFDICESKDEATRSISAECLGRLTLADPERYLVQLQARLRSDSASARIAVLVAVRFTLTETGATYDELLAPLLVEFLSLLKDSDVEVRRNAVLAFSSAAYNKPHLVREWLSTLLPLLYNETKPDSKLLRKVPMGPFTITQDDGLELRKNAFETMITLLDTCFHKITIEDFVSAVTNGLSDSDSTIKVLCCMMLARLATLSPVIVSNRLDDIAGPLLTTLRVKLKESATQQEVEKAAELQRAIYRTISALDKISVNSSAHAFAELVAETKANDKSGQYREMELAYARPTASNGFASGE
ncbi:TIP120-domain-containing protein [Tilletiaria anomala UBC 951]|uniref:TIP120-domain-containing protein n=1 Tax=Tilletiaria anomala (strain ATCC 24038 / CBS 436.72 / UBC 951) TaxID=1037660 RepID=A0A066WNH0_TILAU|nr:TIP120-domain-containing protein [Tilletiaria anomala UBC 951]KDN52549.1 TIP120-domain-containing protein [Tilletiaria anomala UBC 951]